MSGYYTLKNELIKIYFLIVMAFLIFVNCSHENICEEYKNTACENTNSELCHDAMKKYPDLSPFECQEKIKTLKTEIFTTTNAL